VVKTLTLKQRSAIERARRTPDLQRILFRRAVGLDWFSAFKEAGFLDPTKIPAPTPSKDEGYVNIPNWPITDYLVATSVEIVDVANESYAVDFIEFIRTATTYAREHNFGNSRVWSQFSKIISNVPPHLIRLDDVTIVDYWLDDLYERGFVAENLGEHWLISLLDRGDKHCKVISMSLLETLYKTKTVEEQYGDSSRKEVVLRFDNWHAKKLTKKLAGKVGRLLELPAVELFQRRLEHILAEVKRDRHSSIWRPAIEDHGQNQSVDNVEDIMLEGYRDSLLGYVEQAPLAAKEYIERVLESSFETIRRIAIYAIDQQYQHLSQLVERVLVSQYFSSNFRHELWNLLHHHYPQFSTDEKRLVQTAIANLVVPDEDGQQSEGANAYRRATWLSAIKDYGEDIAALYQNYVEVVGGEPEHPDFSSYMTGFGVIDHQSPIPKEDLLSLNIEQLVNRLESYHDTGRFGEPGLKGLVKVFRQIIKEGPLRFYNQLHRFSQLDLAYVYEIIDAYGELWREKAQLPWEELWGYLLTFCEDIVTQEKFWSPENTQQRTAFVANRYWVVGEIGRLIEDGTKSDDHAIPEKFLPQVERVLRILLEKEKGSDEFNRAEDAVSVAINSPRGRCIEALINLTLRCCRLADKQLGGHVETWTHFQPIYDAELARANIGEYEFVTLVARYLPNFLYMAKDWVLTNLEKIFDQENYQKWLCAMQGYAYVNRVYEELYNYQKERKNFLRALDDNNVNQTLADKIVQNIAVAYLDGFERLEDESSLIHQLLARKKHSELRQLIWFLWTLRKNGHAKIMDKVFELWPRILNVIDTNTLEGRRLASNLCDWTAFVDEVNDMNRPLIHAVAPYADENHHSYDLLRSTARISERQPLEAYEIWCRMLEVARPDYPREAIQTGLSNLVSIGPEGVRKAKEIVSQYLKGGNEEPLKILNEALASRRVSE
jgi:hypothetical protein